MRYKRRTDGSKYVDRSSELVYVQDKRRVEGGANLFPEHLNDPQKTLSLGGVMVAGISVGL